MLGPYRVTGGDRGGSPGRHLPGGTNRIPATGQPEGLPGIVSARDPERVAPTQTQEARAFRCRSTVRMSSKPHQVGQGRIDSVHLPLEALKGETLDQRLNRVGRIPYPSEACQLIQQAAHGLAYVHSRWKSFIATSVPANLWISESGTKTSSRSWNSSAARDALSFVDSLGDEDGEI